MKVQKVNGANPVLLTVVLMFVKHPCKATLEKSAQFPREFFPSLFSIAPMEISAHYLARHGCTCDPRKLKSKGSRI